MDHIDLSKYFVGKGYKTGRPRCDQQKLLKVILFAFMENGISSLRDLFSANHPPQRRTANSQLFRSLRLITTAFFQYHSGNILVQFRQWFVQIQSLNAGALPGLLCIQNLLYCRRMNIGRGRRLDQLHQNSLKLSQISGPIVILKHHQRIRSKAADLLGVFHIKGIYINAGERFQFSPPFPERKNVQHQTAQFVNQSADCRRKYAGSCRCTGKNNFIFSIGKRVRS